MFLVRPSFVALSSLLLSLSLSPCRSHPVFIFCLAIVLAFCLLFSAMRQLLSDIEKLGCGCHTRASKPISVSCVWGCRGENRLYGLARRVELHRFNLPVVSHFYHFAQRSTIISLSASPPPPKKKRSANATSSDSAQVWENRPL